MSKFQINEQFKFLLRLLQSIPEAFSFFRF